VLLPSTVALLQLPAGNWLESSSDSTEFLHFAGLDLPQFPFVCYNLDKAGALIGPTVSPTGGIYSPRCT